jgi:LacI family transcriptional regulator
MSDVNLKTLARELNLSVSTVSRALNDSFEVSRSTKKKVSNLARQLNYQPNPFARSLRNKSSKTIAVILPEITSNFFSLIINGIENVARANGYHVLIYITHESDAKEVEYCSLLQNGRVDGVLMSMSGHSGDSVHIKSLMARQIPVVFFDRICEEIATTKITTNDYESAYQGTVHLIRKGVGRIAYLGISSGHSISKNRFQGFVDAMKNNHVQIDPEQIVYCTGHEHTDRQKILQLLSVPGRPNGIFAAVEQPALLCYEIVRELDLSIPHDLKLISFSNLRTASLLNPSLTTITQPAFEIGREATRILFKALACHNAQLDDFTIRLKSEIIERESTASI